MDVVVNLGIGLLMLVIAFIVWDWSRIWWRARRHGYITVDGKYNDPPWRWQKSYLAYKLWTWVVRVFTWLIALWHLYLSFSWFTDFAFAMSVL